VESRLLPDIFTETYEAIHTH